MRAIYFVLLSNILFFAACTDPNLIGLEVQPPSDGLSVKLSAKGHHLILNTSKEDSLRTDKVSTLLLGEINNDLVFGKAEASFATQFQLPYNNLNVGNSDSLFVDSVVLSLSYAGFYGEESSVFSVNVYELSESLNADSSYYSNENLTYSNTLSYLNSVVFNSNDSVTIGGTKKAPQLRLTLDNNLGERILNASGTSDLENNANFLTFFKGVFLTVSANGNGAIAYFNPSSSNSKMSVYYHSPNIDSLSIDFGMAGDATRINIFNNKSLTAPSPQLAYIQSMAGQKVAIEIQNLDSLRYFFINKAINKATMSFTLSTDDIALFAPHTKLYLVRINQEGKEVFLTDYLVEGESFFGGNLENNTYTFNITRYFHQLLYDTEFTSELHLVPSGGSVNANRTILKKDEVTLNIVYTDL